MMSDALHGLRRLFAIVFTADRRGVLTLVFVKITEATSLPVQAVALKLITDGVVEHRRALAFGGLAALALSIVMRGVCAAGSHVQYSVGDRTMIALSSHLGRAVNRPAGLELSENPEFHDRIVMLRDGIRMLPGAVIGIGQIVMLGIQLIITAVLLAGVHPAMVALPVLAVIWVWFAGRGNRIAFQAREATAEAMRLDEHLTDLVLSPGPAKELRIFGIEGEILRRAQELWTGSTRAILRGEWRGAALGLVGLTVFTFGVAGCVLGAVLLARYGRATVGDVVLVLNTALLALGQVAGIVWAFRDVAGGMRLVVHMQWLDGVAATAERIPPDVVRPPDRLRSGIDLRDVGFCYPGADRPALAGVNLAIPAGSTVAVVGDNGAGKTTLIKLLCGLYVPSSGSITVDGVDLTDMHPAQWRARIAGTFQDYVNYELLVRENIGQGDLRRLPDSSALTEAVQRAGAADQVRALPAGLDSQLGRRFGGAELSGGQWQRLALARGLLRDAPLLQVLDEPTAALDPAAERALFERYAAGARHAREQAGSVTLLVSHRFSTVRLADLIVVVSAGTVAEFGSHADLMRSESIYAELYRLSTRSYRD
ncbi:ABC transporter ATP-binding protein [Dactylosporangium matsuzakiense]|uniref:ABC transporter permease n=1 Tax=Dactylosporangium matsuzakiense TaxID=53360 RepID=A0A9W6KL33_9ACTN|nr:ABC transporter ATP-binding protein [Dactylosporangium matsuzakiense]GLL02135.1 ABC transporter permease [Dactylosporangium matsuzakiense]